MEFPTITAHTGCDGTAENTVESALRGLELGADLVEVDVRADPDGVLYLGHDELAPGSARVATFQELAASIAPTGGRINLDLKEDRAALLVGGAVRAAGLALRVVVTGCGIDRVRIVRETSPWLPVYLNTRLERRGPGIDAECRIAAEAGCCGLNLEHALCSPFVARAAHERGLLVSVWTVAPGDGFERFVDMGVDNITTRHVAALVALRRGDP
jgi:glycerophosphoryl diester phosphodiesterase